MILVLIAFCVALKILLSKVNFISIISIFPNIVAKVLISDEARNVGGANN